MICGKCEDEGVDVAHVRRCYGVAPQQPRKGQLRDQMMDEYDQQNAAPLFSDAEPERTRISENFTINRRPRTSGQIAAVHARQDIPEEFRMYLEVPYKEKDVAKKDFGAKFNAEIKKWYVDKRNDYPEMPEHWISGREASEALEDGIYIYEPGLGHQDPEFFMIYHTVHGANQQVAKKLRLIPTDQVDDEGDETVEGKWEYEGKGPLNFLTPEMKLDAERAGEYGRVYGFCIRCGRTLTDEDSKARGMGPVCASKM